MPYSLVNNDASFGNGFGNGSAHLPQPLWFAGYSVEAEEADPESTLSLYRRALALRRGLLTGESLEWVETGRDDVLHFRRPNGWEVVSNFGTRPFPLPAGDVLLTSDRLSESLPAETTVWLKA